MSLAPFPNFRFFRTHHCVTGSMRHIYDFHGHPISEEMLLGLGAGVSFVYWHAKGQPPFIGGRGNAGRPGEEGLEKTAGRRTGVLVASFRTASAKKAEAALLEMLGAGRPVMLQVDMGYLPYFDFHGKEYHFGGHVVVACGFDPAGGEVLIADRDGVPHPVALQVLAEARASKHRPFPPDHRWYAFDFGGKHQPAAEEVRRAVAEQAKAMLEPPISNLGIEGIRKAAARTPKWPDVMGGDALRDALLNAWIFISPTGGSGGGLFRLMFSRFLREAAAADGDEMLTVCADQFKDIGDRWEALGRWFLDASRATAPASRMGECASPLLALADREEAAWKRLREWAGA
ncbi:MAG: BtrH N-terminal domain-containing protein [Acidobacteriota bacterium]